MQFNLKSFTPHLLAAGIFLATAVFYFAPQFSGKAVYQGDVIAYRGMVQELKQFEKETGEESLWTNSMFGGMPSYQISTVNSGNYLKNFIQPSRFFP